MVKEVIGLTGQTGAGKSTARKILKNSGFAVIDADTVSHELTDGNVACIAAVAEHFSCLVLTEQGTLDRRKLGRIVFSDPAELRALNKIMFPFIKAELERRTQKLMHDTNSGVVIDGATLIESGCHKICTTLISVTADEKVRLERIMERDGISIWEAGQRISAQNGEEFYTEASDYVVKNNGTPEELEKEIRFVLGKINEKRRNEHLAEVLQ